MFVAMLAGAAPQTALARLQCVPYAREHSAINLHGDARTWWNQAAGVYDRGSRPRIGAVLAFNGTHAMRAGHVAVVRKIVDDRHILLDHANWSRPGMIEHGALAEDVSSAGDWSLVKVWFAPIHALGLRPNPARGFIYGDRPGKADPAADDQPEGNIVLASAAGDGPGGNARR
ncbi:CHAP domain-containing protein [Novosphingobium lentum]|uniref:CHAP domain-containing protein n=1 Tax=Novosphingobium lentum TaxID=145287 RepID=UPI000830F1E4|nr:CHAP domain-containing protein [Novosphingobium lentum]